MNRWTFLAACLTLGCQGGNESQKQEPVAAEESSAEIKGPPFQSILEWDFGNWPTVTAKPKLMDPKYLAFCRDMSPDGLRRQGDSKQDYGPHDFGLIQVRVNPIGVEQVNAGRPVPVGTVIIKEKHYQPQDQASLAKLNTPFAVAAMIKRAPGYDPEHGDWEYAYQVNLPINEQSTTRGKLTSCIGCHQTVKDQDYLYRKYLVKKD